MPAKWADPDGGWEWLCAGIPDYVAIHGPKKEFLEARLDSYIERFQPKPKPEHIRAVGLQTATANLRAHLADVSNYIGNV